MHIHHLLQVQDTDAAYTTVIVQSVIQAADVHPVILLDRRYSEIHANGTDTYQVLDMGTVR